ncbi:MAG: phosphatidate cytidylyltransferase [Spirochaetales bacterium]|nr:phosphatidate cytidylyltransferase [Spirochaetales bacterium]MBP7262565.1 phosphatidate cytidylyltransferase [Spirochaetia bacterium]
MKNILSRVLLFCLAIPALYGTALFLPYARHVILAVLIVVFACGAGLELLALAEPGASRGRKLTAALLAGLPTVAAYMGGYVLAGPAVSAWLVSVGLAVLGLFLVTGLGMAFPRSPEAMALSLKKASANALLLAYPGMLASSLIPVIGTPGIGGRLIVWFSLIVFANDSLAWLIGISLGRRRGIFKASPNKSLEGLVAGMAGSIGGAMAGPLLLPSLVPQSWLLLGAVGCGLGVLVVAGDLFESALKRAAAVKDSGAAIPGRGGFLDSFDSILFAAPAFMVFVSVLGLA